MSVLDLFSLKGRTTIVTGAGQGIGRAIATAFAEAGSNVVLTGMNVKDPEASETQLRGVAADLEALGGQTLCVVADMRRRDDAESVLAQAVSAFGAVDGLVNNVGGGTVPTPFLELTPQRWNEGLQQNLKTTYLGCRTVGAHMLERGSGAVVNVADIAGIGPLTWYAHYGAPKAGVISITRTLAAELAPQVRFNAIVPYLIRTATVDAVMKADLALEQKALSRTPLGRLGTPEEVAALALFLVSDASSYITGQAIRLTGGAQPGSNLRVILPK